MALAFQRICEILIVRQPTGFIGGHPQFFEQLGNATQVLYDERAPAIPGLRIQFTAKRDLGKEPNTCKLVITNLASANRLDIERKPTYVIVRAGYDGVAKLMFTGNVRAAWSELKGTDYETTIELGDGADAFKNARLNRSYKAPIDPARIISEAVGSMGLKLPPEIERSAELKEALKIGFSAHGPTRDVLTRVLAPYGYGWSMQNGTVRILRSKDTLGADILVAPPPDGGLIGSPTKSAPDKKTGISEVSFDHCLEPDLEPAQSIKLKSKAINGRFKITDCEYTGDTRGTDWKTGVKARPI